MKAAEEDHYLVIEGSSVWEKAASFCTLFKKEGMGSTQSTFWGTFMLALFTSTIVF